MTLFTKFLIGKHYFQILDSISFLCNAETLPSQTIPSHTEFQLLSELPWMRLDHLLQLWIFQPKPPEKIKCGSYVCNFIKFTSSLPNFWRLLLLIRNPNLSIWSRFNPVKLMNRIKETHMSIYTWMRFESYWVQVWYCCKPSGHKAESSSWLSISYFILRLYYQLFRFCQSRVYSIPLIY